MFRVIVLIAVLTATAAASDNSLDLPWGTTFEEISKSLNLEVFENPLLKKSNKRFLDKDVRKSFSLYIATEDGEPYTFEVQGLKLHRMFGFCNDSLIYIILGTEEMPYSKADEDKYQAIIEQAIWPESLKTLWSPIWKAEREGGTIFNEGGMGAFCNSDRTYHELQITMGIITNPRHLQFTVFQMDRTFFEELTESEDYKMDEVLKERFGSHLSFTRYITKKDISWAREYLNSEK